MHPPGRAPAAPPSSAAAATSASYTPPAISSSTSAASPCPYTTVPATSTTKPRACSAENLRKTTRGATHTHPKIKEGATAINPSATRTAPAAATTRTFLSNTHRPRRAPARARARTQTPAPQRSPGPALPQLAHPRGRVEQRQIDQPHKQRARRLQHGAEHGAQVAGHAHAGHVVGQQGGHVQRQDAGDGGGGGDHVPRVAGVLVDAAAVGAGQALHERQHEQQHGGGAEQALVADDLERRDGQVGLGSRGPRVLGGGGVG